MDGSEGTGEEVRFQAAQPPAVGGVRRWLGRALLVVLAFAWLVVVFRTFLIEAGPRQVALRFATSIGGVLVAVLAARDAWPGRWQRWGYSLLVLQVLVAASWWWLVDATWAPWIVLLAVLAGFAIGPHGLEIPEDVPRQAALVVLVVLALGPIVDAVVLAPAPAPAEVDPGTGFTPGDAERTWIGPGSAQVVQTPLESGEHPPVELVSAQVRADEPRHRVLGQAFQQWDRTSYAIPLVFVLSYQEDTFDREALEDDWEVVTRGYERGEKVFFIFGEEHGEREVIVLEHVGSEVRPQLVPPATTTWNHLAGYRFTEAGNNSHARAALDGNTTVDGHRLDPPEEAREHVDRAGEYQRTTPMGPAALGALLGAALIAHRRDT
jgi:hypothetical protein